MNLHSSQEPVAESLEASSTVGAPSAPSKSTTTVAGYSCSARMTDALSRSLSGTTSPHSTGDLGLDAWILSLADSRVRTSAPPEEAQASAVNGQDSGQKWPGLLAKYDRDASSWKTAQCSLFEDSEPSLEIWPRWGSMLNGVAYQRQQPAHLTSGTGCGLWQTPTVQDANGRDRHNQRDGSTRPSLLGQARTWPTPTATQHKGWSPNHNRADTDDRLDYTVERQCFKLGQPTPPMRLNPGWVEWLMGWPSGWTDLKPLVMGKFQEWLQQHGKR